MNKQLIVLSLGMGALLLATQQAFAQRANCGPRQDVLRQLTEKYGEARQAMGLAANNALVEVFASEATGSWTITMTTPTGAMCLVASGQSFEVGVEDLIPASGKDT